MKDNDVLYVWNEQSLVGHLWRDKASNLGFRYENKWIANGFAISQQLPLSKQEYPPAERHAHQFFANLLPEAGARTHIVKDLKISNNDFELLKAIGGECAGALSILPTDYKPSKKATYKKLSHQDLSTLLLRKGNLTSFVAEKNRPRLSLAGAQDKCPILYDGKDYFLPQGVAPSTHIIKFELSHYRNIPAYEFFLTQLAKTIHLPTVNCELKQNEKHYFLLVQRYDRVESNHKTIERLHQEDFCQALGIGYEHKYQQESGPSFYDCYKLVQRISTNPIIDSEYLLKWQMFNYLAGNSDGHAKNLALLYSDKNQVRLAPFYDLVCTRAVERIDSKLALSIGGEFNPDKIIERHWEHLSKQCGIRFKYLREILFETSETIIKQLEPTITQFEETIGPYPALQRIQHIVTKQCQRVLKRTR